MLGADEVRKILEPYEPAILANIHGAWQDFTELGIAAKLRYKRNRAGLVHDFIVQRSMVNWADDTGVVCLEKDETAKFVFEDKVVVRFKKADGNGLGSNIMTQAVLAFIDPQAELPGLLPSLAKVEITYALNALETKIETISVMARDGDRELWSYVIEEKGGAAIIPLPIPAAPAPSDPDVKVVPKPLPDRTKKNG